eukprot:jgi/Pico_ML_1/53139/g3743.t1
MAAVGTLTTSFAAMTVGNASGRSVRRQRSTAAPRGLASFEGFRNAAEMPGRVSPVTSTVSFVTNGAKVLAMRHGYKTPKLNLPADQRKALLRSLTTELLRHGRIKTTKARAKAVRKHADRMITLAKGGSLHERRQALGYIYDKDLVHALFEAAADRYGDRNGGYTRILNTVSRRGDNAEMAIIELV